MGRVKGHAGGGRRGPMGPQGLRVLLACLLGGVAVAQAQQGIPVFPSEVELVTVDAVVLDSAGRPVPGLAREDFVVTEDGHPQEIASFEAFALEPVPAAPAPRAAIASNEPTASTLGRAFTILVDDLEISPPRAGIARQAAASFFERAVRDGDEVTLGTTSGAVWWSARMPEGRADVVAVLGLVKGTTFAPSALDRMSEYEAFRIKNYEDSPEMSASGPAAAAGISLPPQASAGVSSDTSVPAGHGRTRERVKRRWADAGICAPTSCDGMIRARASEIDARRRTRVHLTLQAVRRGLEALALVHGRKSLLLFSEGFLQDSGTEVREVVAASREANAAIYFVDVRGLVAAPGFGSAEDFGPPPDPFDQGQMRFEESTLTIAGSQALADDTGGFSVRNTNDLSAGSERIADESRVFYLLGFHPPGGKGQGQWRKLKVEVKRPGLTVRARRGYTLRAAAAGAGAKPGKKDKPGPDPVVSHALDSAHDEAGIPLRAMTYVFEPRPKDTTHVIVAAEFDAGRVALQPKGGKRMGRLDVSVVTTLRDSGRGFRHDDTLDLKLDTADAPGWRSLVREFEVPAGVAQVRVVVRDPSTGAIGSVLQRFEVPPPGSLRLSTPILTDRLVPAADGKGRPQPALAVHRVFRPSGLLYYQFQVFGAAVPAPGGVPRVSAGVDVRRDDRVVRSAPSTPIAADPDGRLVRFVALGLDGLDEGDYELRLRVRDQTNGTHLERVEPFILARQTSSP